MEFKLLRFMRCTAVTLMKYICYITFVSLNKESIENVSQLISLYIYIYIYTVHIYVYCICAVHFSRGQQQCLYPHIAVWHEKCMYCKGIMADLIVFMGWSTGGISAGINCKLLL